MVTHPGSVVDDEVRAGELLERADIAAPRPMMRPLRSSDGIVDTVFSAEWSAATRWMARLKIIAGLLVCSGFRLCFRIADNRGRFVSNLILQRGEQFVLLPRASYRDTPSKALRGFLLDLSDIALAALDRPCNEEI